MKKLIMLLIACLGSTVVCNGEPIQDVYDLKMTLKVPRTYNNEHSLGYRKYQTQRVKGLLVLTYTDVFTRPEVSIVGLTNVTHRMSNGLLVSYDVTVGNYEVATRFNLIGSNKTEKFDVASVVFYIDADPIYNVGNDEEDNALLVTLSGSGKTSTSLVKGCRIIKTMQGSVAGTLGCGCTAYGHVSATRVAGPFGILHYLPEGWDAVMYPWSYPCGAEEIVDDVASVYGTWSAKYNKKLSRR